MDKRNSESEIVNTVTMVTNINKMSDAFGMSGLSESVYVLKPVLFFPF